MIYETVAETEPIRQGDIFVGVPKIEIELSRLVVLDPDEEPRVTTWRDAIEEPGGTPVTAVLPIKPVRGIVITQNCDAVRGQSLVLSEIDTFTNLSGSTPGTPKAWQSHITKHARTNLRYFYLPADDSVSFDQKMGCDFRTLVRVARTDLEAMRDHRVGRLNPLAVEHFRETLGQFFRRYPYNEWYPLTRDELDAYKNSKPEPIDPYPWQT